MRKLFSIVFFLIAFIAFNIHVKAQDSTMFRKHPPKNNFLDKVYIEPIFGLQFGTITFIEVSPIVGYRINDKISAGVGAIYQYYQYNVTPVFHTDVYGGRVFGRYFFTNNLFAHAEYEYLNLEAFDFLPRRRVDVESILAGGGYIQRFGRNSGIIAMILYNFTESVYTPYSNPIIRIGVNIGL